MIPNTSEYVYCCLIMTHPWHTYKVQYSFHTMRSRKADRNLPSVVPAKNRENYCTAENHSSQKWSVTTYCQNWEVHLLDLPSFLTFLIEKNNVRHSNHLNSCVNLSASDCVCGAHFGVVHLLYDDFLVPYNRQSLKKNYRRWRVCAVYGSRYVPTVRHSIM